MGGRAGCIILVVFLVLMVMVLLNLLIAIMSDAAARASGGRSALQSHVMHPSLVSSAPRARTVVWMHSRRLTRPGSIVCVCGHG